MSLIDNKVFKLRGLGYSGTHQEMGRQFALAQVGVASLAAYWQSLVPGYTGAREDIKRAALMSKGYSGTVQDMENQFWLNYSGNPAAAAALVFAKYPGNVHVYLPSQSIYSDTGGTTAAVSGGVVALIKDSQGTTNLSQATTANQPSANLTSGYWSLVYRNGTSQGLLGANTLNPATDHCLVVGASWSAGTASGISFVNMAAGSSFSKAAALQAMNTGVTSRWTNSGGPDFDASSTVSTLTTGHVFTSRRVGNTGTNRVNGTVQSTVDLSATSAITVTQSGIGSLIEDLSDPFTGNIYPVIVVNGVMTDADLLTLERYANSLTPTGVNF